ncbi:MAG: hypothetical protein IPI81_06555 [Flavobacteriales bacterium]|nr:hypothetical protein [Flavobacteriales bacterium]
MFRVVDTTCDVYVAVWTPLVPFATAVAAFKAKIKAIEDEIETQSTELDGYAMDKGKKKETMVRKAHSVANQVFAYAEDVGDTVLREKMDVSYSDLIAPRDSIVGQKCQGIHTEANAVIASLAPYGILPLDLTDLQGFIDAYELVISAPRVAITVRKGATERIETLIREGTTILTNRMDKLMSEFKDSDPVFHQEYFDARIVVNSGSVKEEVPVPPGP